MSDSFDSIMPYAERREINEAVSTITITLFTARLTVMNLHAFLKNRIDGTALSVDKRDQGM